jgi:hypothetical protein
MNVCFLRILPCFFAGLATVCFVAPMGAQSAGLERPQAALTQALVELPDAPQPQFVQEPTPAPVPDQTLAQKPAAGTPAASQDQSGSSSSSDTPAAPQAGAPQKSQHELAEEQLKQQKKQRVFGILPSFNTSYNDQAVSLTAKQKFKLAFSQSTDPFQFFIAGFAAGLSEAEGSDHGYGGGPAGYFKRMGSDYADSFDGAMIGNALLPAVLHQDPRFFRRGYGTTKRRIFYAISTSFICKHDGTGKWEPNYSNLGGNLAAGAISNLYVPQDERGVGNVFEGAALVTIEGGVGAILQEFWPDISRHFLHKDPTNGRDAANRALRQ